MFDAVLVANRGEIARRVLRTCRAMGLRGIAVYSDEDRDLPYVQEADLALRLGPAPAADSYLNTGRILALAQGNGAAAVHPGYGFLSESADFAEACAEQDVVFVGAPPAAIRLMGDKAAARRAVAADGVPTIPGYDVPGADDAALLAAAEGVGYPLFVKAVAGGGGRGIRLVHKAADLPAALQSARREADAAFGNGALLLEKAVTDARHIEVQVVADRQGRVVALGERDCSLQRRHQKLVEESPAPGLPEGLRTRLTAAAVQATRAAAYEGAGTVEFLVQGETFYFLEMNTRLQVEHPVTELVWGVDLVRLQLEIAAGQPLPQQLGEDGAPEPHGHALECRLIAEDPAADFLPAVGPLVALHLPEGPGRRIDAGYATGNAVGSWYDSLLAKLCTWGPTRDEALRRMQRLLAESHVAGLPTNLTLLQQLVTHPVLQRGGASTQELAAAIQECLPETAPMPSMGQGAGSVELSDEAEEVLLAAAALEAWQQEMATAAHRTIQAEPNPAIPPLRGLLRRRFGLGDAVRNLTMEWRPSAKGLRLRVWQRDEANDTNLEAREVEWLARPEMQAQWQASGSMADWGAASGPASKIDTNVSGIGHGTAHLVLGGVLLPLRYTVAPETFWLSLRDRHWRVERLGGESAASATADLIAEGIVRAPLPGRVLEVAVEAGAQVPAGGLLLVMEAMKVEHRLTAPWAGTVSAVHCETGKPVARGETLLTLLAPEDSKA